MLRLVAPAVLAGLFFSTTFILNEMMSVNGGHWFWSASLRYVFMLVFLCIILLSKGGVKQLAAVCCLFIENWFFWIVSGSVGFGFFYALICYSADYAPAWMVASTWQFTVVAGLFVLRVFGRRFALRVWWYALLVFIGVCCIQYGHAVNDVGIRWQKILFAGLPPLLAAFCYPLGNQLVWEAQNAVKSRAFLIPYIPSPLLHDAFSKVFLLSLGSMPFWILLGLLVQPAWPQSSQLTQAAAVALFSGVVATSLFLYARGLARTAAEIAAVDATQATEVIFALLGSMLFLRSDPPDTLAWLGIALVIGGLWLFSRHRQSAAE